MVYTEYKPSGPDGRGIRKIFHFRGFNPDYSVERVVPTGHVHLIFELDDIPRHLFDNDSHQPLNTYTGAWLSGIHTGYITISAHENSEMLVVEFEPDGAYPFLHEPMHTFRNVVLPAEDIFGPTIVELRDRINTMTASNEMFETVLAWLTRRVDPTLYSPEAFTSVLGEIRTAPVARLGEIVESYPRTHKHLIDSFNRRVGIPPKSIQRILRFNDVLGRIQSEESIPWADIAYACGYSDQSHFIREFRYHSGFNPQKFIDLRYNQQVPNFFPLDRDG